MLKVKERNVCRKMIRKNKCNANQNTKELSLSEFLPKYPSQNNLHDKKNVEENITLKDASKVVTEEKEKERDEGDIFEEKSKVQHQKSEKEKQMKKINVKIEEKINKNEKMIEEQTQFEKEVKIEFKNGADTIVKSMEIILENINQDSNEDEENVKSIRKPNKRQKGVNKKYQVEKIKIKM